MIEYRKFFDSCAWEQFAAAAIAGLLSHHYTESGGGIAPIYETTERIGVVAGFAAEIADKLLELRDQRIAASQEGA